MSTAIEFKRASKERINAYPRPYVSGISVSDEVLAVYDAALRALSVGNQELHEELIDNLHELYEDGYSLDSDDFSRFMAIMNAEIRVLWEHLDGPKPKDVLLNIDSSGEDNNWYQILSLAYNRPETVPYLNAGIRDVAYIESCLAADVDVELSDTSGR